jgi:hypothetical protein
MGMKELTMVMYFARKIRILFIRGFQDNLSNPCKMDCANSGIVKTYLGIIRKLMSREIDLAEGAFAN